MKASILRLLPIVVLASASFSSCVSTREGMIVATSQPRDSEAVLHVVEQTADEFGLRPVYVDDTGGPKVLCAYGRSDGTRIVVSQPDAKHLWVETNKYHETDQESPSQADVRKALEKRLQAVFPANELREKKGHPAAHWVVESS
jgi:hypothetical protein